MTLYPTKNVWTYFRKYILACYLTFLQKMKLFNENRIVLTRGKDKSLSCAAFSFKGGERWESSNDDRLMVEKDLGG
jgi:hypothetical protein